MKRIGIFGGSFNPIHNGHISIAEELLKTNFVEEIWFVISPQNPLKEKTDLWADRLRYNIAVKALESHKLLKPCDIEFRLPKPSFMFTTLEELCRQNPEHQFVLLIGADNWLCFKSWYRWKEIMDKHEIGIYPRPGYDIDESSLPSSVRYFQTGLYDISSTEIRRRLKAGEPIDALVPKEVSDYLFALKNSTTI